MNIFTDAKVVGDNIDSAEYHQQDVKRGDPSFVMSRSELMTFAYCPRGWVDGAREEGTRETLFGQMVDCLLLQPDLFDDKFAVSPVEYPATPKKKGDPVEMKPWTRQATYCKEWEAERQKEGKAVVSHEEDVRAAEAYEAFTGDRELLEFVECSKASVLITANYLDPQTGITVPVKCLPDLVPSAGHPKFGKSLGDLKTATCAHPGVWPKHIHEYGLDIQAAMCLDMYVAATGEDRVDFRHVIVESKKPYNRGRRILSDEFIRLGRSKYRQALALYAWCLETGEWPEYDTNGGFNGWSIVEPSAWMVT